MAGGGMVPMKPALGRKPKKKRKEKSPLMKGLGY